METRFYLIGVGTIPDDNEQVEELTDEEFMTLAEEQGTVYSCEGFAEDLNHDNIDTTDYWVRAITTK